MESYISINASNLRNIIKTELNIFGDNDNARIEYLIAEAVYRLQQFKCKTLVDTVTDSATQTTLTPLDNRFIVLYCGLQFDGDDRFQAALNDTIEQVRDK